MFSQHFRRLTTMLVACGGFLISVAGADAADWPRYRGPNADGASLEKGLFRRADNFKLDLAWKRELGSGYSGVAIAEGHVVTMFADGSNDVMAAFDPSSGAEKWRVEISSSYAGHDGSHDGPLSTPLIEDGRVYGLGAQGRLFAVELTNGRELWSTELVADHKARTPFYGFSTAPLIQDGVLVVEIGGEDAAVMGLNPDDGKVLWTAGQDAVMHQSPIPFRFEGFQQVVVSGNTNMMGLNAKTGEVMWEYAHGGSGPQGIWSMVPVPAGDGRMFLAHQDEASSMIALKRKDDILVAEKLWEGKSIKKSYNVPVYHDGYLYAYSSRILTCVDAATGEMVWRSREPGDGFMVLADGHLVITTKKGSVHVVRASPEGYREVANLELFEDLAWTEPSVANGSIYLRSLSELVRVDIARGGSGAIAAKKREVPGTLLAGLLKKLDRAPDKKKSKIIQSFMKSQDSFPVIEGNIVHFLYQGPGEDIAVAGDMIGARHDEKMTRVEGTDLYHYSTKLEPDARINYMFVRDYEALLDPRNPRKTATAVLNNEMDMAFSGELTDMSWFSMPQWKGPNFLGDPAPAQRGRLVTHELESKPMGSKTSFDVYLPAGYDAGDATYPVAYVHGGTLAKERGQLPRALDNLVSKSVRPVIVVFIGAQPPLFGSPAPYAQMVVSELVPFIDKTYRTNASAESRASIGNGGVGFPAMLCTLMQPGVFGKVGVQSGMFFDFALNVLQPMLRTATEQPLDVYMDWGLYDLRSPNEQWDLGQKNADFAAMLREKGYTPSGGRVHDGTGWSSWANRTDRMFEALFPL